MCIPSAVALTHRKARRRQLINQSIYLRTLAHTGDNVEKSIFFFFCSFSFAPYSNSPPGTIINIIRAAAARQQ